MQHQALDDDETSSAEQAHRKIYPQGHESAPDPDAVKNGDPDEVGGAIFAQVRSSSSKLTWPATYQLILVLNNYRC
jgi:hypothetical protein